MGDGTSRYSRGSSFHWLSLVIQFSVVHMNEFICDWTSKSAREQKRPAMYGISGASSSSKGAAGAGDTRGSSSNAPLFKSEESLTFLPPHVLSLL